MKGLEWGEKMSTPSGFKELWKNVTWKNKDEKLAFFNRYFKNSDILNDYIENRIKSIARDLVYFIENNKVKEKGKERPVTIQDIKNKIKELIK